MPRISYLATAIVIFWIVVVAFVFLISGSMEILLYGIPMIILLYLIPVLMAWLNRRTFRNVANEYRPAAIEKGISTIGMDDVGKVVHIKGTIRKISLLWLARPRFVIASNKGEVDVMMLFMPEIDVKVGDKVKILGAVGRGIFKRGTVTISAFSIERIDARSGANEK